MYDISSRIPQLNSFLRCAPLRVGCLIIGWLVCVVETGKYIVAVVSPIISALSPTNFDPELDAQSFMTGDFDYSQLLNPIVDVFFLIGIYKSKAEFLLPLLIVYAVTIINSTVYVLLLLITKERSLTYAAILYGLISEDFVPDIFYSPLPLLPLILIDLYLFLVANSYFNVLRNSPKNDVDLPM